MNDSRKTSKNSGPPRSWMVMLVNGRVMGPYSTEAVLKMISEGALGGSEKIKIENSGQWIAISKEPQFYDQLLEALEGSNQSPKNPDYAKKLNLPESMAQETVIAPLPTEALVPPTEDSKQPEPEMQGNYEETIILPPATSANRQGQLSTQPRTQITGANKITLNLEKIDSVDVSAVQKLKKFVIPAAVLVTMLILGYIFLDGSPQDDSDKIQLLIPRYGSTTTLSGNELKSEIQKAVFSFQQDTFESYIEAQNRLVSILEKAPQSMESRSFLCLAYRELWPFTRQDSHDIDAIQVLVKSTKAIDPVGPFSAACEISKLFIFGKYADARGMLNYLFEQKQFATEPILILFKTEIMALDQDAQSAAMFADTVQKFWPKWMKAKYLRAQYLLQAGQTQAAAKAYEEIIQENPRHKASIIQLGILYYRFLKKSDIALDYLRKALLGKSRVTRQQEAQANFVVAQIFTEQKKFDEAKPYAQKAYELNPGDSEFKNLLVQLGGNTRLHKKNYKHNELVFLGDQYMRAGDCLSAQAEFKAAFELDNSNGVAATKAAKCLWQLNQSTEAINWLNKAIQADANLVEAYTTLADYYTQRYNYQAALQILSRAARKFTNNGEVLRGYGLLEYRRNNMKDAIGFLQRSLKIYENDIETLLLMAKAQAATGEYQSAQNYSVRAMQLDSTNNEAIVVYAKNLVQFRGLNAGLYYIKEQISKFSYTIEFRLALAEMYRDVERYRDAQTVYEQIIEADPKNKKALIGLGECQQAIGSFDKALKIYLNAAILDPTDAEPLMKMGQLYIDMNRFNEAKTQFDRAMKVNPNYPRVNYYAGKASFLNLDYSSALKYCEMERKINPNLADSYILSAEIYSALRDYAKCAGEYQQAVRLRPQGAEIYVKMARCYRQAGSADIAEKMLIVAVGIESGLPDIYKEQGAIYEGRGEYAFAVRAYDKYLALSPNAPDRSEIEQRINSLNR